MKSILVILTVFLVLSTHVHGRSRPAEDLTEHSGPLDRVKTFLKAAVKRFVNTQPEFETLKRVKRSQVVPIDGSSIYTSEQCTTNASCVSPDLGGDVPTDLVYCDNGVCVCKGCFVNLRNLCQVEAPLCRNYSTADRKCVDFRKSQKTTFLLSVFLSSVGAANFYIGDYALGGSQLGLLLLAILFVVCAVAVPLCIVCCVDDDDLEDDECKECCVLTIFGLSIFMAILVLFIISCWWVADLAIFAYNGRNDLNGCPLIADL